MSRWPRAGPGTGLQLFADPRRAVQEAGAARGAQELAAGRGEQGAADFADVDGHMADG